MFGIGEVRRLSINYSCLSSNWFGDWMLMKLIIFPSVYSSFTKANHQENRYEWFFHPLSLVGVLKEVTLSSWHRLVSSAFSIWLWSMLSFFTELFLSYYLLIPTTHHSLCLRSHYMRLLFSYGTIFVRIIFNGVFA